MEPVPTVRELAARGLAQERTTSVGKTTQTYFTVSEEGYRILSDVMARNGRKAKAWNEARSRG